MASIRTRHPFSAQMRPAKPTMKPGALRLPRPWRSRRREGTTPHTASSERDRRRENLSTASWLRGEQAIDATNVEALPETGQTAGRRPDVLDDRASNARAPTPPPSRPGLAGPFRSSAPRGSTAPRRERRRSVREKVGWRIRSRPSPDRAQGKGNGVRCRPGAHAPAPIRTGRTRSGTATRSAPTATTGSPCALREHAQAPARGAHRTRVVKQARSGARAGSEAQAGIRGCSPSL